MELDESKLWIYDIETLAGCYLLGAKRLGVEEWKWFEISKYRNDIDSLVKWIKDSDIIHCGFNNLSFDSQVVQYIADMGPHWWNMTGSEIVSIIYGFAQDLIHNQDYEVRKLPYKEAYLDVPQIDLFTIMGYSNKNKSTSLKWIEFSLDMPIQEMPWDHTIKDLTEQQCEDTRKYCESDIRTTEQLYCLVRGRVTNSFYEEKDEIQYRLDAIKEVELPKIAINYSNIQLGAAIVMKGYMKESGMNINQIWEKKKKSKARTKFKFGECIPEYVKFKTPEFKAIYEHVRVQEADIWVKQDYPFSYNGTNYLIAKGGLHSQDLPGIYKASKLCIIKDADIGSQYPNSINKRKVHPAHMGIAWNVNYVNEILKRTGPDGYKKKGKTSKYYKGLAETWKYVLNGGSINKFAHLN